MNGLPLNHLSEQQLLEVYYGEIDGAEHLGACEACRIEFEHLREVLDSLREYRGPERDAGHASEVWNRLLPQLPPDRPRRVWLRWWALTPAFAALLTIAFVTGRLTERGNHPSGISEKARERVLLISLSDHLEQSQIVLANVAHAAPGTSDLVNERDRAHELLGANRLLRQTAARLGDLTDVALLDELERVLLSVANTPAVSSAGDLERIQHRIEQEGLLFRVRITSSASRERGQKL